jgi:predicted RNA binding protein YcfA (HicA-like mRNA interferase family)
MTRIPPVDWRRLRCVFEHDGFVFKKRSRRGGSHWVGEKTGVARPIIIPEYDSIGLDIITRNMRTAGMTRERFLELLQRC